MHSLENNEPNVAYVEVRQVPLITPEIFCGNGGGGYREPFTVAKLFLCLPTLPS